ncbi:MAG: hypothetical protein OEZ01_01020 [Candidatus Heimdallarchaeota archaeon]|nr:hypothetical protein [Candidatus Heimdallarchaeota archaeon]MDH5644555.1 hypothetical protein [Candidatus Heimdallarchaeota archaeon]
MNYILLFFILILLVIVYIQYQQHFNTKDIPTNNKIHFIEVQDTIDPSELMVLADIGDCVFINLRILRNEVGKFDQFLTILKSSVIKYKYQLHKITHDLYLLTKNSDNFDVRYLNSRSNILFKDLFSPVI